MAACGRYGPSTVSQCKTDMVARALEASRGVVPAVQVLGSQTGGV